MKNILFTFSLLFLTLFGANTISAQVVESGAQIEFTKEIIDYGTIKKHANGEREFVFKNTGNEPLIISDAKGSCGCTVPTWPKEPIAPGESGSIKVKYDTARLGVFSKSVTIQSNSMGNDATKVLRIKGEVTE